MALTSNVTRYVTHIINLSMLHRNFKYILWIKKSIKKYVDLMHQAQQATWRKEAVGLIHKAAKLKTKFENYEMM